METEIRVIIGLKVKVSADLNMIKSDSILCVSLHGYVFTADYIIKL